MKFTSEDLMKTMGLQVGDRIKAPNGVIYEVVSEVVDYANVIGLINKGKYEDNYFPLKMLVCDEDFEILPRPKRVGDLKCNGKCPLCPCIYVCNDQVNAIDKTLYEVLELGIATFTKTPKKMNEEIHNVIKARLDKEVLSND